MQHNRWRGALVATGRLWRVGAAFEDPRVERDFRDWHANLRAPQRRAGLYFGLVAWIAAVAFDLTGESPGPIGFGAHPEIFVMRAAGTLAIVGAVLASLSNRFRTFYCAEVAIWAPSTLCQILLVTMTMTQDRPFDFQSDLPGPILFMFGTVGLYRIAAKSYLALLAVVVPFTLAALFGAVAQSIGWEVHAARPAVSAVVFSDNYDRAAAYVLIAALISYAIAAQLERGSREAFARERRLADANDDLLASRLDADAKAQALIAAKEGLRAAAERESANKSKFLADATHDLSQPIHAVNLLLDAADHALGHDEPVKAKSILADATRAAGVARSSFRSIMEISRFQSGLIEPKIATFDAADMLAEVLHPLRAEAAALGVTLRTRAPKGVRSLVSSDRGLVGRVIANLTSNAIRYADPQKPHPSVLVAIARAPGRVRLDVFDNGVGIPETRREDVFQPFLQLETPDGRADRGLGLGLSIVDAIVRLLPGCELRLSSAVGRFTRFSLYLPAPVTGEGEPIAETTAAIPDDRVASLFVWCVEDDPIALSATASLLDRWGVLTEQSASFGDLREALAGAERPPDLILTDFRLPEGFDANHVAAAFAARWGQDIPMLVLTGEKTLDLDPHADAPILVLEKPASPDEISSALRELCFRAQAAAEG